MDGWKDGSAGERGYTYIDDPHARRQEHLLPKLVWHLRANVGVEVDVQRVRDEQNSHREAAIGARERYVVGP